MKNRLLKITAIIAIILVTVLSYSVISVGGIKYKGVSYDSIESLATLARVDNDLFREIPATDIIGANFDYGYLTGTESNVVCVEHYNKNDGGTYGKIWRVIDINPDGVNTLKVNGSTQTVTDYETKRYLNAVAEAASKCEGGAENWGLTNTKAAYTSLANSSQLSDIFRLDGDYDASAYIYNNTVEGYINTYLENAKDVANTNPTKIEAIKSENIESTAISDGTIIGPFKYKSENGQNVIFDTIKVTGKSEKGEVLFERAVTLDSLYVDSLGTKTIANGSIKPEQEFYIKTDKSIEEASKIKVEINIKNIGYYQTRILIFRQGDQQTFSAYSVGNGKTTKLNQNLEYEFENNRKGNIVIHKSGERTGSSVSKIENVGFKIYYKENGKKVYLKIDNEKVIGTTENANEVSIIYTDKNGDAYVKGVNSERKYFIEEFTDNTNYSSNILKVTQKFDGKDAEEVELSVIEAGTIGEVTVKREKESKQTTVTIVDAASTGTLKLLKLDYDKQNIKIFGAKFKIQNKETKQWVKADGSNGTYKLKTYNDSYKKDSEYYKENYTSNENEATEFETNKNGEITVEGIDVGKYILKEVFIVNDNGKVNYGYTEVDKPSDIDSNYVFWSIDGGKTKYNLAKKQIQLEVIETEKQEESSIIVYNKKKYMKIKGYVWEDVAGGKDNTYAVYGQDTYAEGDKLVEGLTVRLIDKNGNTIITKTDKNGAYEFSEVSREAVENGSYYVEFEYNGLTYTSVVTLVGDDNSINSKAGEVIEQRKKLNNAFTEITNKDNIEDRSHGYSRDSKGNVTGTLTYTNHTENWYSTFEGTTYNNETYNNVNLTANTNISKYSLEKEFKEGRYSVDDNDAFVIENVNFGLRRREMPEISISNDIENVQVDVNGYSHRYDYAQRNKYKNNKTAFNVGVKFGNEYVGGYTRAIYPSDIQYSSTDAQDSNKLKVYVTYVTTVHNLSNSLAVSVNELVNYYDSRYTIVGSWLEDNESNKVSWLDVSKYGQNNSTDKFKSAYTTSISKSKINAGEEINIHVKFQVSDEAVLGLLNNSTTLENVSEVFSYSTYYGRDAEGCNSGDTYAGIDTVSAPGNAKMELNSENKLIKTTYEADTDSAPSLLLEAKGVRTIEGTVFEDETSKELQTNKERKGDGIYNSSKENVVSGVKVELLTTEEKIATIYPNTTDKNGNPVANTKGEKAETVTGTDGKYIFRGIEPGKYFIRYTYSNGTTKVFDINGNELKDIDVQNYKSTIITSDTIKKAFEENEKNLMWYKESGNRYSDARDNYEQRKAIDSELTTIDATTGKDGYHNNSLNADSPKFDLNIEYETIYTASNGDYYEYKVSDIDFGIVERPRQSATLDKVINSIKVTLPNGQVLVDGNPQNKLNYVTVTDDTIYITMDSELIYGSQLEIKYDLILTNTSELDYISRNYYDYGIKEGELIKFSRATLVDYVDREIALKVGENGNWTVIGTAEELAEKGFNWDLSKEEEEQLLNNYSTIVKAEPVSEDEQLEPGQSKSSSIIVERLLSTNDNELSFNNNGEVVTVVKNGGAKLTTIPGSFAKLLAGTPTEENLNAGLDAKPVEADEDKALSLNIIPPTGSTNYNVMYAIIGIVSLAVLGIGTYGIRKFLKK